MGTEQRPYIGTWKLNQKKVVQHTPDCLVYINGDLTIPGVDTKGRQYRIDLQKFITGVQVDCANTPSGATANISISIPTHSNEPFARDANNILTTGLEVHIYMRGYFPVRGLFRGTGNDIVTYDDNGRLVTATVEDDEILTSDTKIDIIDTTYNVQLDPHYVAKNYLDKRNKFGDFTDRRYGADGEDILGRTASMAETLALLLQANGYTNCTMHDKNGCTTHGHVKHSAHHKGTAIDQASGDVTYTDANGETKSVPFYAVFAMNVVAQEKGWIPSGGAGWYGENPRSGMGSGYGGGTGPHSDWRSGWYDNRDPNMPKPRIWYWRDANGNKVKGGASWTYATLPNGEKSDLLGTYNIDRANLPQYLKDEIYRLREMFDKGDFDIVPTALLINNARKDGQTSITMSGGRSAVLSKGGSNRTRFRGQGSIRPKTRYDDLFAYPYYHVFHGCVTNVSFSYSPGVQTATMGCGSMLHFWSYQNMSTNASVFGARPSNSKNRVSLLGHNFTGQHPYEIIYTLFHDTAGAAGSVNFVMDQKTNVDTVLGENSLYSLTIKYWEERFSQKVMNLRLHGATGALYNTLQATAMAKISTQEMQAAFNNRNPRLGNQGGSSASSDVMGGLSSLGLIEQRKQAKTTAQNNKTAQAQAQQSAQGQPPSAAQLDQASFGNSGGFGKGGKPLDLNVFMMEAYVKDIGQIASINLFESSYETKMDIANKVCEITGFEFYQDVDGDCVFKPPMYNLDTSSSRVYRIEDIDMISWSESEKEPEATFMVTKGSQFANLAGTGVDGEWGVQGTFIDYPLVAKYGWRSGSFETAYFNDARQCFFASINRMAVLNASVNSGSCTIPIRPEMRPGYPVYVPTYDCFYYCTSISHSYQVGGACQTTLQLVAKRKKFYAPGDPNKSGIESIHLDGFALPPKPLQVLRKDGYTELSGFPNVVMTLDPNLTNPMFYVSGADFESLTNEENLEGLLKILAQTSIEGNTFKYDEKTQTFSWKQDASGQTKYFSIDSATGTSRSSGRFGSGTQSNPYNLFAAAGQKDERRLSSSGEKYNQNVASQGQKVAIISDQINEILESKRSIPPGDPNGNEQAVRAYRQQEDYDKQLVRLRDKLRVEGKKLRDMQKAPPSSSSNTVFTKSAKGIDYLMEMLSLVRRYGKYDDDRFNKDWKNLQSSSNLLDLISNKKANLSNGQIPGSYRYYSSAHPDPEHQGKAIGYVNSGNNSQNATPVGKTSPLGIPKDAPQYVPTANITVPDPFYQQPEAELKESAPIKNGIPIIGADGKEQVTPTDEIHSLRFQLVKGKVRSQAWRKVSDFNRTLITEDDFFLGLLSVFSDSRFDAKVGFTADVLGHFRTEMATQRDIFIDTGEGTDDALQSDMKMYAFLDFYYRYTFEDLWMSEQPYFNSSKWGGWKAGNFNDMLRQAQDGLSGHMYFVPKDEKFGRPCSAIMLQGYFNGNDFNTKGSNTSINHNPIYPNTSSMGRNLYQVSRIVFPLDFPINAISCMLDYNTNQKEKTDNIVMNISRTKYGQNLYGIRQRALDYQHQYYDLTNGRPLNDAIPFYICINNIVARNCEIRGVRSNRVLDDGRTYMETGKLVFRATTTFQRVVSDEHGYFPNDLEESGNFVGYLKKYTLRVMAKTYYEVWSNIVDQYGHSSNKMKTTVKFIQKAFHIKKNPIGYRMANVWEWKDITTQVPVFPISDARGYEVFGHYPYGRGLDIFANNPLDTILQTDPFIGVDRQTVENYVLALQGKTVTITESDGSQTTLSGGDLAMKGATKQLEIALQNEYSPQELLDYGLATLNSKNMLQISVQNWLADKSRDGVQKVTVENRAFSIADLGFLSDLSSLPSDLKSSQSDVLLPAYSSNFADIIAYNNASSTAGLIDQLMATTESGEPKTMDMVHSIINQENRSPNWSQSQSALRGVAFETQNSADIIKDALETVSDNFDRITQQSTDNFNRALEEQQRAKENLENPDLPDNLNET